MSSSRDTPTTPRSAAARRRAALQPLSQQHSANSPSEAGTAASFGDFESSPLKQRSSTTQSSFLGRPSAGLDSDAENNDTRDNHRKDTAESRVSQSPAFLSSPLRGAQQHQREGEGGVRLPEMSRVQIMPPTSLVRPRRTVEHATGSPLAYQLSSERTGPTSRRRALPTSQNTDSLLSQLLPNEGSSQLGQGSPSSTSRHRRGDVAGNRFLDRLRGHQGSQSDPAGNIMGEVNEPSSVADPSSDPAAIGRVIWGTTINMAESMQMFSDFLQNFTHSEAVAAEDNEGRINEGPRPFYPTLLRQLKEGGILNMNLDCANLRNYEPALKLYKQLQRYPQEIIPLMDHTLTDFFLELFDDVQMPDGVTMRVRPFNLARSVNLRQLNPCDIDQLVSVKGILIRASPLIPDLKQAFYRCHVCDHTVVVDLDRGRIAEPTACPREACKSKNSMQVVHNRCGFADKQICRLQETPDETPDGQTPHTVSMCVYDDLVDVSKAGDRVEITGIFRGIPVRVNPRRRAIKALFKTYVDIVHIKRTDAKRLGVDRTAVADNEYTVQFEEGDRIAHADPLEEQSIVELSQRPDLYDLLARSIAPSIFGMEDVKKGVLLQLFGGANKFNKDRKPEPGTPRIRGDINILLVGDPGVSKSQLLGYVHKVAPRGVYTSGKGSSAVGLTAYVTRDPDSKQLVLESGALVLSDGGICCIDEFDKMSDYTRSVLHEVMEQQTISVAKAGIITTLNARTSILACANPIHSKFDDRLPLVENINLPPPLLSRFDLTYLILDKPDERDDRRLAQHLVAFYLDAAGSDAQEARERESGKPEVIPIEMFTKYVNRAKAVSNPVIGAEAAEALVDYYVKLRKMGGERTITFTTRQLESMIRLAEAHARMRLSQTVDAPDVHEAHRLVITALQTAAVDPKTGLIDLDLVNTGISARTRAMHGDKRAALRNLLVDELLQQGGSGTVRGVRWAEAYRAFNDQADVSVGEAEFNSLLEQLMDEGVVVTTGRTNADTVIRRAATA